MNIQHIPFQFTRRKPIKEQKLLGTFRWNFLQVIAKIDGKNRVAPEGTLMPELEFPAFIFFLGQRSIKVVYYKSSL